MVGAPSISLLARWRSAAVAAACAGLLCTAVQAQTLPGGVQLGMTLEQLRQAVPARKVVHPARLAGGLSGSWSGPAVDLAGVALTPTYFLSDQQLLRIDYLASTNDVTGAFDALLQWGRAQWGPELASQAPEGSYATWSQGDLDAYVQQATAPRQVRLVIKRRLVKDGSEL